ncbi:hypothetical protein FAES_2203 [Fibrella aestuarina BUZ 2]|uniref:Uncharacterized protein n=1 Tax=Fibrella aestuarina BUZ 2 TaxID=1166018 RepID=I0K7V9_9BACT|nr:hypothetical protein [Fibrella aestuarina]CCH00212.1 hypothetical protein FAES_2203 [Fibrella aestuarina BUZ 2]
MRLATKRTGRQRTWLCARIRPPADFAQIVTDGLGTFRFGVPSVGLQGFGEMER